MMVMNVNKIQQYVIGAKNVPHWCKGKITPFRKMNGSTGYEFRGMEKDFELAKGDKLLLHKGLILVKRKYRTKSL